MESLNNGKKKHFFYSRKATQFFLLRKIHLFVLAIITNTKYILRYFVPLKVYIYIYIYIYIIGIQPLGRSRQRPEFSQATGMALVRCILGKFLGVVCHCFPPLVSILMKYQVDEIGEYGIGDTGRMHTGI